MHYYKWLHDTIFSIVPYGWDNFHKGWHLVLFNWWIPLKWNFPSKVQTSFVYMPDEQQWCFTRYWGKPTAHDESNEDCIPYASTFIKTPWCRVLYKELVWHNNKWEVFHPTCSNWAQQLEEEKQFKDTLNTTFSFMENGKRVIVKAQTVGEKYYYGIWWFPQWLKPLFHEVKTTAWITFSEGIGKGRGTWKGGTCGIQYPWDKNLSTTWLNFEYLELPKYIKGEK